MDWKTRAADYDSIRSLQEKYALDLLTARILAGRGVKSPDDVKFYLENDISFLNNPFLFEDMTAFCDRIAEAVEGREKVHVFGDRDVDGITSTALLVREFRSMGLDVSYTVPMGDEPYGISKDKIDAIAKDGITLAITVDCGISCFEEIEYATSIGVDFLVTDHHIPGALIPNAVAVIDPKIQGCGYPFMDLAGCAVAAKCIWSVRFSNTPLYNSPFILLHAMPGNNGTVIIEAARMQNLIVEDRIVEEVVPGCLPQENSRLLRFLDCGLPVRVFDEETERIQLRTAFPKADIYLQDLRPMFEKHLPATRGRSLFDLSAMSRFAIYSPVRSELETLIGLFRACARAMYPSIHKEYLQVMELAAIGTVSDLMPLCGENRIIVRNGLKVLESNPSDSMRPFLSLANLLGHRLSTTDISWHISPAMNASGRLGRPDVAVEMLLTSDQRLAYSSAQMLMDMNDERKKLGEKAWDRTQKQARQSYEDLGTKMVIVYDKEIQRGITGILATRLLKTFKAPSLVITMANGRAVGSLRSLNGFNCHDFLSSYADLFDDFGGHACAGGFSLSPEKVEHLLIRISKDLDYMDCPQQEEDNSVTIDAKLEHSDMSERIFKLVERMEPYGERNDQLVFRLDNVRITDLIGMRNSSNEGQGHLRMNLQLENGTKWPAVFWGAAPRVGKDDEHGFSDGEIADVVFKLGKNWYRGQENVQLTVMDIRRSRLG